MGRRQVDLIRLGFHLGQACEVCTQNLSWLYDVRLRALDRILMQLELDVANTIAAPALQRFIETTISATAPLRDNALGEIRQRGQHAFFDEIFRLSHSLRQPIRLTLSADERNCFQIGELLAESQRESDAMSALVNLQEKRTARRRGRRHTERDLVAERDLLQRIAVEGLDSTLQRMQPFKYRNAASLRKLLKPFGVSLEELSGGPNAAMAALSDGSSCDVIAMFDYPVDGWSQIDAYLLKMRPLSSADPTPKLEGRWVVNSHFKIEIDEATRQARKLATDVSVGFSKAEWVVFEFFVRSRGAPLETTSILRELGIGDDAYRRRKVSVRAKIHNLGLEFKQEGSRENARHRMQVLRAVQPPKPVIRTDGEA